ncbi:hypothetical protein GCM10028821_08100 [Hymenobacter jeollabukensis]
MYMKYIKTANGSIDWFTYSAAYSNSPDYILIKSDTRVDTVCVVDNILDVKIDKDKMLIHCNGQPSLYTKEVALPKEMAGYFVELDTDRVAFSAKGRKYFKLTDVPAGAKEYDAQMGR